MAIKKYHILDSTKKRVESNLPDQTHVDTVIAFLKEQNPHEQYTVEEETVYTVKGLGRDPDLH